MSSLALSETDRFSVIKLFEERQLVPAERAVRCGGRRVKGASKARLGGTGRALYAKLESDLFADPNFVGQLVEGQSQALKASHGAAPPPPPTKLTMAHLQGMIETESRTDHLKTKHNSPKVSSNNHAAPRPNVNNARANKMGSNKRT